MLKVATNPRPTVAPRRRRRPRRPAPVAAGPGAPAAAGDRRRAGCRANACGAPTGRAGRSGGRAGSNADGAPAAPAAPGAPAAAVDPRWGQMDQAYRERAAGANRGTTQ